MEPRAFELLIGSKNWSSWSLRPWFLMKAFDIPFQEVVIPLRQEDTAEKLRLLTPSGLVPVLKSPDQTVWDSLAIAETLADLYPAKMLWPEDVVARAFGRTISAEMHSGFAPLRREMPMDFVNEVKGFQPSPEAQANIDRIVGLWQEARGRFRAQGPYLLGALSIADAMYAPVVSRFRTYGVNLPAEGSDYADLMWDHPVMAEWFLGAAKE